MKTGAAHASRQTRAQNDRKADAEGREARRDLGKEPRTIVRGKPAPTGKLGSPFGLRNSLLCQARKAHRSGLTAQVQKFTAEAAELAPLTATEKRNIERALPR